MIETERLTLSTWTPTERDPFIAMCADPEVMHDYGGPWGRARAITRFDRFLSTSERGNIDKLAIRRKADAAFLGWCGVSQIWPTLTLAPGLEVGWRLARWAWGAGYATEAARVALQDAFNRTDAPEVFSFTPPSNQRSLAVMGRLGLCRDERRDFTYEDGNPAVVYVALREHFEG